METHSNGDPYSEGDAFIEGDNWFIAVSEGHERIGNHWMPLWLEVGFQNPGEPIFFGRVELRDGVPRTVEFRIKAMPDSREIMQKDLREAEVNAAIHGLYSAFVISQDDEKKEVYTHIDEDGEISLEIQHFIEGLRTPGKRRVDTALLKDVARVYRENVDHAPTQAVARVFGVKHRQASNYVSDARKRGFLPPTKQGRAKA